MLEVFQIYTIELLETWVTLGVQRLAFSLRLKSTFKISQYNMEQKWANFGRTRANLSRGEYLSEKSETVHYDFWEF